MAEFEVERVDRSEISPNPINMIWREFNEEFQKNPDQYIEEEVNAMETDLKIIRRFNTIHKNKALPALVKAMRWRKLNNVHTLSESELPLEFFKAGLMFTNGKDRENNRLLICRVKACKKFEEWTKTLQRYFVLLVEHQHRWLENNDSKGVTIVLDFDESTCGPNDTELLLFMLSVMIDYYPCLLNCVIAHRLRSDVPLNSFRKQVVPKSCRKIFKFTNNLSELKKFVDEAELPDFMGGTSELCYRKQPTDAPNMSVFAKMHDFNEDQLNEYLKHLHPFLSDK